MKLPSKDIHCHILPGVDDGFRSAGDSLQALSRMASEGVREIVFTPHLNPDVYPDGTEEQMRRVYAEFAPTIPGELGLTTSLAAEYMVVNGFERRAEDIQSLLTWPDGTILVEMSYYFRSNNLESALFELSMAGLKPVLAHPERYSYMSGSLKTFEKWREMGCRFQMNLMSLTGKYGPDSVRILMHLLKEGFYDFVATDLHSLPQLSSILESDPCKRRLRKLLEKSGLL